MDVIALLLLAFLLLLTVRLIEGIDRLGTGDTT